MSRSPTRAHSHKGYPLGSDASPLGNASLFLFSVTWFIGVCPFQQSQT